MITCNVRQREIVIELDVSCSGQGRQRVDAVIDTGYNGFLTLPSHVVNSLHLPFGGYRRAMLADGSIIRLSVHLATVDWHGQPRDVLVSQAEGSQLIGMAMLEGSRVTMDVVDGGGVTIEELPSP